MATLWTLGASQTEGFLSKSEWARKYVEWKQYTPKVFGQIIANKLKYEFINLGTSGTDNYTIFETYCKNVKNIKQNDIVVICWTDVVRFRIAFNNIWQSFTIDTTSSNFENFPVEVLKNMLVNRYEQKIYTQEINNFIDFINFKCTNKIIHWTDYYGELKCNLLGGFQTIEEETKGELKDPHYSEKGHVELADKLLNLINSNQNNFLI